MSPQVNCIAFLFSTLFLVLPGHLYQFINFPPVLCFSLPLPLLKVLDCSAFFTIKLSGVWQQGYCKILLMASGHLVVMSRTKDHRTLRTLKTQ